LHRTADCYKSESLLRKEVLCEAQMSQSVPIFYRSNVLPIESCSCLLFLNQPLGAVTS